MGPGTLAKILEHLPPMTDDRLLVGPETCDDAGVYLLDEERALIQTIDFFTPIVDDPYLFGQIAAANALSDVYAMGGVPLTAMNVVCFPSRKLDLGILREILRGGADKVREAGAVIVGGHTVEDAEPKYGLAVTGIVHPQKLMTNGGARPGEILILTKPLGSGIISTALKAGLAGPETIQTATAAMAALNRTAAEVALELGVRSCTDVTGFGLLGHAAEMALASGVGLRLWLEAIPVYPQALELAAMGLVPGGAYANRRFLAGRVSFAGDIKEAEQDLLFDPQTSGGLLFTVPADREEECLARLRERGARAAAVGEVVAEPAGGLEVVRTRRS